MKIYIQNIKTSLAELADAEFQRQTWLSESDTEISSFPELLCQLFDDTGLSDIIDDPELDRYFGESIANKFRNLDRLTTKIDQHTEPSVLIELPEMEEVRNLAKDILNSFPD